MMKINEVIILTPNEYKERLAEIDKMKADLDKEFYGTSSSFANAGGGYIFNY